jgi:hypothetical protein
LLGCQSHGLIVYTGSVFCPLREMSIELNEVFGPATVILDGERMQLADEGFKCADHFVNAGKARCYFAWRPVFVERS